jgi:prepilin-type N-terminal cleavage/methylation domain-containing protein
VAELNLTGFVGQIWLVRHVFRGIVTPSRKSMRTPHHRPSAGFTLIELLTVIAIIGILASIIIPTVGSVRDKAQRAVDSSNIREVGKAAIIYAGDNNDRLPDPSSSPAPTITGTKVYIWAGLLAKAGVLTDATLYFSKSDPVGPATIPLSVLDATDTTKNTLNADFTAQKPSLELVGGLKLSDPATTPVAFTRGLSTAGTWDNNSDGTGKSVYGDVGGHIAFLGGNVQYYKNLGTADASGRLIKTNGKTTIDITQTIPKTSTQKIYGNGGTIGTTAGTTPTTAN